MKAFSSPIIQFNGHLQTILPSLFRKISVEYQRERLELPDGDFLDIDWSRKDASKLVIITHGLEGDSTRHYVTGMAKIANDSGFDALGWNCRSCSGEINRLPRFYHHGDAEDLRFVVDYAASLGIYREIYLVGFSMGGSLTLRYLGEKPDKVHPLVRKVVAASVPLDLPTSVRELAKTGKQFYMKRFIKKLHKKIEEKERMFPHHPILTAKNYHTIQNFEDFDSRYTAPLHGYTDCHDFYAKASVKPLLKNITIPSLIVQAANDPFLTPECLELGEANRNSAVELIVTQNGGHVGFVQKRKLHTWVEETALAFFQ
ncbi:MAG: YheT family hydrolase [Spirosomataceae bacterium]